MSGLILPSSYSRRSNPLAEFLRERDAGDFEDGVELSKAFIATLGIVSRGRHMSNKRVLRSLCTVISSVVQSVAPHEEWQDVADILCHEIKNRLIVDQD